MSLLKLDELRLYVEYHRLHLEYCMWNITLKRHSYLISELDLFRDLLVPVKFNACKPVFTRKGHLVITAEKKTIEICF